MQPSTKANKTMQTLLKEERHHYILDMLRRDGKILAGKLCAELGISEDTMRRDLRELAEAGKLQRVHGGALPASPILPDHDSRERQSPEAKAAIAHAVLPLLHNGQVILIDSGTTTLQVAKILPHDLRATVITNSPPIATALAEAPLLDVMMLGGRLLKDSLATIGASVIETLSLIRADICLLGICSLHPEVGITTPDLDEAHVKRAMIHSAAEVVALAASNKLGTAAPYVVSPLNELTHLVTEKNASEQTLAPYRALGITIIQA